MIKQFFTALSYIFHPLFLPFLGLFFLFELTTESQGYIDTSLSNLRWDVKKALYILIGFLTILAPSLSVYIMYRNKMITSLTIENRSERVIPLLLISVYYILTYIFLLRMLPSQTIIPFLLPYVFGFTLSTVVAFIMNFYIKISLHMVGVFGVAGALTGYFQSQVEYNIWYLLALIIIGGLVGSSRLYLKAHNLKEILFGIIFGFGIEYFCMKFELFI
jgi:membrane-associated phospholipid phosphatase